MKKKKNFFLGLCLVLLFSSCDVLRSVKRKVKSVLFGVKIEDAKDGQNNENREETYEGIVNRPITENEQKVFMVTPQKKILNLCSGHVHAMDISFKNLLTLEMKEKPGLFGKDMDEELVTCLSMYIPHIEGKNTDAIDTIYEWYNYLSGINQVEAEKILATSLDYEPVYLIKKYSAKLESKNCSLAILILPTVPAEKKFDVLYERKLTLMKTAKHFQDSDREKSFLVSCIRRLTEEISGGRSVSSSPASSVENLEEIRNSNNNVKDDEKQENDEGYGPPASE